LTLLVYIDIEVVMINYVSCLWMCLISKRVVSE